MVNSFVLQLLSHRQFCCMCLAKVLRLFSEIVSGEEVFEVGVELLLDNTGIGAFESSSLCSHNIW
jgi:hypothetical protein